MSYIKLIFIALIIFVVFLAVFQNEEMFIHEHRVQFDLWVYQLPAYFVKNYALLAIAFGFGVILSIFMGIFTSLGKRSEIKNSRRRIKELEKEISIMKTAAPSAPSGSGVNQSEKPSNIPFVAPGS